MFKVTTTIHFTIHRKCIYKNHFAQRNSQIILKFFINILKTNILKFIKISNNTISNIKIIFNMFNYIYKQEQHYHYIE